MIDDGIMHETWRHLCTKTRKKDDVGIVTFDVIGLLPTNHIIAHSTMAYRSFRGNVQCEKFINSQTTKNIWNFIVVKSNSTRNCKLRQLSGRFQTSNLETGRNGSKSGVSQIIWESWQHCIFAFWFLQKSSLQIQKPTFYLRSYFLLGCPWEQCPIKKYMYLPGRFVCPIPPFSRGQFLQGGDGSFQVISGDLAKAKLLLGVIGPIFTSLCTDCPSPQ